MKFLFSILMIVFVLIGCSSEPEHKYTPEVAKEKGDVVSDYGVVGNIDKLDSFIQNTEKNQEDEVKITRFTKEGDPVFITLQFDGKSISVNRDSSMDKFGGGSSMTSCTKLNKSETDKGTRYYLDGCKDYAGGDLLFVPKK